PRSAHFVEEGKHLVVCYLHHGIVCWDVQTKEQLWRICPGVRIGCSSLSPDHKTIVISNLLNGFDLYDLQSRVLLQTYTVRMRENVILPVRFIHNGTALLFGSSCGMVTIVDRSTGCLIDVLSHGG
ncbi:hypothetical protein OBBRIDRAFT_697070, partial [Obba rivulosa]